MPERINITHHDLLTTALEQRRLQGLYRQRGILETPQCAEVVYQNRPVITFASNDYLGLANHPRIRQAYQQGIEQWGNGSGAAHLATGHGRMHHALEEELAEWTGRPRALLFSTGYMANLGVIGALANKGDVIFEDRLNHASLIDAGLASQARMRRYPHQACSILAKHLQATTAPQKFVLTDGVFSMDGDLAPLKKLAQLCQQHQAWLMVDDAHGLGVLGRRGGGTVETAQLDRYDVPILMGTLGKAFGTFGAFVAGSETLIETLIQFARPYIYTTALPPAVAAATRTSLQIVKQETWRREYLQALIQRFKQGANELGLNLLPSDTPIQPLVLGDVQQATQLSQALLNKGILACAIRPPTVPAGTSRLRLTLSVSHSETHVDQLLDTLQALACH